MLQKEGNDVVRQKNRFRLWWIPFLCIWGIIIGFCVYHRDKLSVENIIGFTPNSPVLAALVMLLLFALKSLSIVFYSGVLYAADGILFPLPVAIGLNICGTAVIVSLPYWIGKKAGSPLVEKIRAKYPKVNKLSEIRDNNNFFFVFLARFIGLLPCDILSLYMGAIGIPYPTYLLGCLLGMLPATITFPVMGMNIGNMRSPAFRTALGAELLIMASSFLILRLYQKKRKKKGEENENRCD